MNLLSVYDFIAVEMEEVRELFDEQLRSDEVVVADMIEEVGKFRGKMLRPMLVLLSGKMCGAIEHEHHVIAAVAEMVHMATLVHDDVLDEAGRRRRGRTINALHGNEAAVILGDLLISGAFGLCSSLDSPAAARLMAATTNTVCRGELLQLHYRGYYDLSEERYLEIVEQKTASLIAVCCYLGAQAAACGAETAERLEQFGRLLGLAYQIMDDVTDIVGDEQAAGKTLGTDLAQGKVTLPVIHYLRQCDSRARARMREMLEAGEQTDCRELAAELDKCDSLDYARRRAADFLRQGKELLGENPQNRAQQVLLEVASMVA